jgi:urease accessory protein
MKAAEVSITHPKPIDWGTGQAVQPRAVGAADVSVHAVDGQTRLVGLRQSGALRLLFPRAPKGTVTAVSINTAGGITGGDRFDLAAHAVAGAHLTLTTQAAERGYRAQSGEVAQVTTRLRAEDGATLRWLPQETILFRHCALRRRLRIDIEGSARLLMVEPVVFGRTAMGEALDQGHFCDRIAIYRDGTPVYLDGMTLTGDIAATLARPAVANGAVAMASLVYVAPDASAQLAPIRALLPDTGGASLLADDMLVLRALASDSYLLRRSLIPVLDLLTHNTLPPTWRL